MAKFSHACSLYVFESFSFYLVAVPFISPFYAVSLSPSLSLARSLSLSLFICHSLCFCLYSERFSLCLSLSLCGMFAYVDMCVRIQQNTEQFFNQVCIVNIARKRCSFTRPEREFDESVCAVEFGTLMRYSGKIQRFVFVFCFPIKLVH